MSQINVNRIRNFDGEGLGIDIANGGNVSFNTDTLFIDATNNRVATGHTAPTTCFHMEGGTGLNAFTAPIREPINIVSDSINGSPNIDVAGSGNVHIFTTASTGNFTPNIGTGANAANDLSSILDVGQFLTVTIYVAIGGSSGFTTGLNIAGVAATVNWQEGEAPEEVADGSATTGYDGYQYQIYRTDTSVYEVFAGKSWYDQ